MDILYAIGDFLLQGLGVMLLAFFFCVMLFLVLAPTALLPGVAVAATLNRRLAQPDLRDAEPETRRETLIAAAAAVTVFAGLRITYAIHANNGEPDWGIALVVAGLAQIATTAVTVPRNAPWIGRAALAWRYGLPLVLGLLFVYARPLHDLLG